MRSRLHRTNFRCMIDIMPELVQILFGVAVLAAVVAIAVWHRYRFIVRLRSGSPRLLKGKVTAAFLDDLASICRDAGIRRGWLGGVGRGKRVTLSFSWHFPADVR